MKLHLLWPLLLLAACSTGKVQESAPLEPHEVTKDSFKKDKALGARDVSDFYTLEGKSQNPALQDETLDRYSAEELKNLDTSADPLMEISIRCLKKDFDNAFIVASKVFNRYQKVPIYWNQIANCHLNKGSPRKALLFYNKALEVSPGYVPALNNIGVLYTRQGEDQKALIAFQRANKQSRFSKTPRYNLAKLYLSYGLTESAIPLFIGLLNEAPSDVDILNSVASAYVLSSNYQRAQEYFDRIPAGYYKNAEVGLNLVITLKKLGKAKEAADLYSDIDVPNHKALKEYYASVGKHLGVK
jgi:tetratricopeptide (TPR) repeat protein